jgi:hypothetical protein
VVRERIREEVGAERRGRGDGKTARNRDKRQSVAETALIAGTTTVTEGQTDRQYSRIRTNLVVFVEEA